MRNTSRLLSALLLAVALTLGSVMTAGAAEGNSPWDAIRQDLAALASRVSALEAPDPGTADEFWPVDQIETGVNVNAAQYSWGEWYINVSVEASTAPDPQYIDTPGYGSYQSVLVLRYDGKTYRGEGAISLDSMDVAEMPPAGTPLEVEYWVEKYGIRRHETVTITDWDYIDWSYPPYPW